MGEPLSLASSGLLMIRLRVTRCLDTHLFSIAAALMAHVDMGKQAASGLKGS